MDPLAAVAGVAAAVGAVLAVAAVKQWARARRAEKEIGRLRRELAAERHAACHDQLTGLPNRRSFHSAGSALIREAARRPLIAILVDLDDFKRINDTLGHRAGDDVLVAVARRLASVAGDGLVARLGGDEFVALLDRTPPPGDQTAAYRHRLPEIVDGIAEVLSVPISVTGGWTVAVRASIGFAPVPGGAALEEVLEHADAAMYRAKAAPTPGRALPRTSRRRSSETGANWFSPGEQPGQVTSPVDALASF